MTRVLFLTESFCPVLGGGERHIRVLASHLAASGMPCTVVTRRTFGSSPADETLDGVRVVRVAPSGPGRVGKYRMVPAAMRVLARERKSYDVMVVRGTRVLGLPGLMTCRLLGKAVVFQAEVNGEMSGEAFGWGTRAQAGFLRRIVGAAVAIRNPWMRDADAFVAMSRQIRDEFASAGVAENRTFLIPHGIDTEQFRPPSEAERQVARQRLGLSPEAVVVTFTGRLLRGKGLETLIEAFAAVAFDRPQAHLVLVGSGTGQSLSVEDQLRKRAAEDGLASRVSFRGPVEDVREHLFVSDVFAFPSVFEALGLSLLEAAACGLACIGSRTGGIVDVIDDGRSGLLVTPGSVEDLATALRSLIDRPSRRLELGAAARARIQTRFDLQVSLEAYRGLFSELARRAVACGSRRAPRGGGTHPLSRGLPA